MRRPANSLWSCRVRCRQTYSPFLVNKLSIRRRYARIYATPSSSTPPTQLEIEAEGSAHQPDAKFEVLGAPFSLLSVTLSASQNLFTRRGTLVALSGKAENAVSTLSILSPFSRTLFGIPFLYQKISSTSPVSALISTKDALTSFTVVHLDGRLDWIVAQRSALLAWTGHALSVKPTFNTKMSAAHWGNTHTSGRGLLGLVGKGQIYQISLKTGEDYVVHPSNVVAYTMTQFPPLPYRFRSTTLKLQVPSLTGWFPETKFFTEMRKTAVYKGVFGVAFTLRTWARRTIWGDRLFLQFRGPTTLLLQSRSSRVSDSLSTRDINEIADSPAGATQEVVATLNLDGASATKASGTVPPSRATEEQPRTIKYATVTRDGKVEIK
ncbi:hypothetical protein EJ08DRAFT_99732 [Tothia fuscella]|uniref:Altered inheritance of mitochondria protein 24, mitochondrial n=1 Tax=Tothia fuscella TaxID=1048955 RepID=A0A9P4NE19_9PEZI|nr:hypothetical protein EJ08DRAFT_99732 [Tothia fuscella]